MGGYGGMNRSMPSMNRTPSFGSPMGGRSMGGFQGANPYASGGGRSISGAQGGGAASGSRSGSYTTRRGGEINYGAAGAGAVGPNGGAAGRGIGGAQATTAGGRTLTNVGRAGGAVGPGGRAVGGRSNVAVGTGPNGAVAGGSRAGIAAGPNRVVAGGSRAGVASGPNGVVAGRSAAAGWRNPAYANFNNRWVHGYWGGHYNGWGWGRYGGYGWGMGAYGLGAMTAMTAWGLGSALYSGGWGYMPYSNPYYYGQQAAVSQPIYDYSTPINTASAAPSEDVTSQASGLFEQAQAAFKGGEYAQALALTDQAIKLMPDNSTLHEFRALAQFALGKYDDASATLYSVLAVGPGWDWTTLSSFYPDVDVFASQQKTLEDYIRENPDSGSARFYLAYVYLTEGHNNAAVKQLARCVQIQPKDQVSARLLQSLQAAQEMQAKQTETGEEEAAPSEPAPAQPAPSEAEPAGKLAGQWVAKPAPDTTITLSTQEDGTFEWTVHANGQAHTLKGQSSYVDGVLTLVQSDQTAPLVGRVTWSDADDFVFQALGGGSADPGLSFHKGS